MTEFGVVLAMAAALSLSVTKATDFIRNAADSQNRAPAWVWNVVALLIGLAFALGWQLNIAVALVGLVPALAEHASDMGGTSGQVLTGVIIGLGAGFWHSLLASLSSIAHKNDATAVSLMK